MDSGTHFCPNVAKASIKWELPHTQLGSYPVHYLLIITAYKYFALGNMSDHQ